MEGDLMDETRGGKAGGLMSALRCGEGNPASAVQRDFTSFCR
jgi:hypothetical protein